MVARRNRNYFMSENVGEEQSRTFDTAKKSKELYEDSFMRREKIERLRKQQESQYTFKPQLVSKSKSSNILNRSISRGRSTANQSHLIEDINGVIKEVDERSDL